MTDIVYVCFEAIAPRMRCADLNMCFDSLQYFCLEIAPRMRCVDYKKRKEMHVCHQIILPILD